MSPMEVADVPLLDESEPPAQARDRGYAGTRKPLTITLICSLAALTGGYTLGYTSPLHAPASMHVCTSVRGNGTDTGTLPILPGHEHAVDEEAWSTFGALVNLGALIGAIVSTPIMTRWGRRATMIAGQIPIIAGYWIIYGAAGDNALIWLDVGRVLTGVALGINSISVPIYVSEIAPPKIRGALGTVVQLTFVLGVLMAYVAGYLLPRRGETLYRDLAWVGTIIPTVLLFALWCVPLSPRWLLTKGRATDARTALSSLRESGYDVDDEILEVQISIARANAEGKASIAELFSGPTLKALLMLGGLMVYQEFTGEMVVIYYSGKIFATAGIENASLAAVFVSIVQVVVTIFSIPLIDRVGRKPLLYAATIGMFIMFMLLGAIMAEHEEGRSGNKALAIVAVVGVVGSYSIGLGSIPWLLMSEVFLLKYRGPASTLITVINYAATFVVTKTFHKMLCSPMESSGTFWFYGGVCLAGVAFIKLFVPETKGKTLEEIEAFFTPGPTGQRGLPHGSYRDGARFELMTLQSNEKPEPIYE